MNIEDKANNIFLQFYSVLILMDELYDVIRISDLAIKMAIVHVNLVKDDDYIKIIKQLKKMKNDK
jgi:hypothetical protein